jgi:hypothetical protein
VLYVVWSQDRTRDLKDADARHENRTGRYREMFLLHPENVFLVKGSYWISL